MAHLQSTSIAAASLLTCCSPSSTRHQRGLTEVSSSCVSFSFDRHQQRVPGSKMPAMRAVCVSASLTLNRQMDRELDAIRLWARCPAHAPPPPWFIPTPLPLPLPSSPHVSHPSIQPSTHTPIQPIPRTPITGQASLAPGRQNLIAYPTTAFNWAAGSTSALPTLESPLAVNAEGAKRHGYARQVLGVRRFEPGGRSHTLGQSRQRSSKAGRRVEV